MSTVLDNRAPDRLSFICPGCGCSHSVPVAGPVAWTWNQSLERPTFAPSIHVQWGADRRCHSFVRDGQIEYLADSTHDLRGQTVPLPVIG